MSRPPEAPARLWWTAAELAEAGLPDLPGTTRGVNVWAQRLGLRRDPALARQRQGRGGGWEYHWTALPLAARKALLARAGGGARRECEAERAEAERAEVWAWFEGLPEAAQARARARLAAVREVLALEPGASRDQAVREVASLRRIAPRTLWRWFGRIEGVREDDWLPALAPRHRAPGARARKVIRAEWDEDFWDWLKSDYLRPARPSFSSCYRRAVAVAREKGWRIAPERTMRRWLDQTVSQPVQVLARHGVEALKRFYPAQERDKTALHALEVVNADYHRFDVFVRWPGIDTPVRPQMVAFQDVFSGRILSWRLDVAATARTVLLAAGDMIEDWGIPEHVLMDNGREFAAKAVSGGAPTRYRFKELDTDIPGLFVALGCEIHWATPYSGQSKPIERAFRDMCDAIAKDPRLAGAWTGNRPDAKPEDYGRRAVPLDDFLKVVRQGIAEHNLRPGRRSEVAFGRSFAEVFDESYARAPIRKATEAQRRLWLLGARGLRARQGNGMITFLGNRYWSDWMHEVAGERVIVRFDPADLQAGLRVYSADNRYLGFAECRAAKGFLSLEDERDHARARRAWMKAERAALEAHRKFTARDLGADLDALAPLEGAPLEPRPEARVIRLMPAAPAPRVDPLRAAAEAAAQAAIVTDLDSRRIGRAAPEEEPRERFRRALDLAARQEAGGPVTPDQARWLEAYRRTAEYRAQHALWEDFGDAYFG